MSYVVSFDSKKYCFGIDLFNDSYIKNYDKDNLDLDRSFNNIQKNNKNSEIMLIKGDTTYLKKNGILVVDDYPSGGGGGTKKTLDEFLKHNNFEIIGKFDLNPGKKQFNQYPIILQKNRYISSMTISFSPPFTVYSTLLFF